MITINTILDMRPGAVPKIIHLSQYDSDFSLVFRLHASFGTLNIESGTTAEIRGTKKSGTGYSASATLNTTNNTVTVAGDAQMTAVAGQNIYEIVLIKNNKVLGSANFILLVERAALDADTITDATVLKELNAIIDSVETATQAAEDAADAADRAEAAAEGAENKVPKPASNPDGTAGQILRTNGDGTTEWANVCTPTDEQTAEAVSDWLDEHPEATTTVQDGAVTSAKLADALTIAKIDSYVTPQQYGAVGDGVADDTSAFSAMESSAKSIVYIPKGVYKISGWETDKSVIMDDEAWLTTDTDKADVITITGDNKVYALNLRLKNTYAHYGVKVNGDHNHFKTVQIDGLNYDGVTLYPNNKINAGVAVFGTFNTFDFVRLNDFVQDYAGNDSAPQGFVFGSTANYNYLADYHINNCRAGVVSAGLAGTVNRIGSMAVHGCGDNGLYCVGGGHTEVGTIFYNGSNECIAVFTDGATVNTLNEELSSVEIGTVICKCNTGFEFPVRLKNAGDINIGNLFINGSINAIVFINTDTIKNSGVSIDNLTLDGSEKFMFYLPSSRGTIEYLRVGRAYIKDKHKNSEQAITGNSANYIIADAVQSINIDKLDFELADAESAFDNQSIKLRMILNSALVDSFIDKISVKNSCNASQVRIDLINAIQNGLTIDRGYFQYNDSENKLTFYQQNKYSDKMYSRLQPTYGTWKTGAIVYSDRAENITIGELGWFCTSGGTPGTWRQLVAFPTQSIVIYNGSKLQYSKNVNGSLTWVDVPTT